MLRERLRLSGVKSRKVTICLTFLKIYIFKLIALRYLRLYRAWREKLKTLFKYNLNLSYQLRLELRSTVDEI